MKYKIFTLFLISLFFTSSAEAALPIAVPFGGPIVMTYECTCSGAWLVVPYDYLTKMPAPMVFRFGESMLRANYNIFTPSVQTLGTYVPDGGMCLMASDDCGGFATNGTITPLPLSGIGTGSI